MTDNITMTPDVTQAAWTWRPHQLHGWAFLSFREGDEEGAPVRGLADASGPMIVFNPVWCPHWLLEDPSAIRLWLASSLAHICHVMLDEAAAANDGIGRFGSSSWTDFRTEVIKHALMSWPEILQALDREGPDYMAEHLVQCLLIESGFLDRVMAGRPNVA
ncbi:hypothetical protein [Neoaquamicrobium sediminum]|uniref:hypothetical protein n=1 Tax=Neoaquamicrobium sediminum TaxID=1849104 RepID=UPI003BA9E92A